MLHTASSEKKNTCMHRRTYPVWEIYSKQDPRRHQNNLEALERSWREQGRHSWPFLLWVALAQMQIWQCNSFNFYRCADPTVQRKILSLYPSFVLWFCSSLSRERERERERERDAGLGPCLHLKTCHEATGIPGCTLISLELTSVGPSKSL